MDLYDSSDGSYKELRELKIKIAEIIASDSNSDIEKLAIILKVIKE